MTEKIFSRGTAAQDKDRDKQLVLIVDGDVMSQFYTSALLQRLNYKVFPVKTAEDALLIMELTIPLLVITEITLPKMSGVDLLTHVKQNSPTRDVPVLIYTAVKASSCRDICMQARCSGYLTHPADENQLFEAIQKATEITPRHFVRLATWLNVIFNTPAGTELGAMVTAISEHGMFVSTQNPLPMGTTTQFIVYLAKSATSGVKVHGQVLYSHAGESTKNRGMGVKFLQVGPDVRAVLRDFVKDQLAQGIAPPIKKS
jgi:CheY-like chemotaxis protein/Tfp pilus assembly protein PilZ